MAKHRVPRRRRRPVEPGEFADPGENFAPPRPADDLERALTQDTVRDMKIAPYKTVPPDTPVEEVLRIMVRLDIACVLVTEDDRLLGVVSERDVLTRIGEHFEQVRRQPVRTVMTPQPEYVYETASPATVINLMAVGGFRHVPVLDVDDRLVGVLGPRRVVNYLESHLSPA